MENRVFHVIVIVLYTKSIRRYLMKYKFNYVVTPLLLAVSLAVNADYKTTGFSDEEYQKVAEASGDYRNCLNDSAMGQIEQQNDIRIIADYAMKACAPVLENLYNYLASANYDPEAIKPLLGSISNRAANKILSNLMRYKAIQKP
tara:strand:+ start:8113 stop:8547 length:435 start_codon:yes stop_codon:yes gene_type:complete